MSRKDVHQRYIRGESEKIDDIVKDSYQNSIRLERRNLLMVSLIIITCSISKINPATAKLLGLSFDNLTPSIFYGVLVSINVYFLFAYIVYAWPIYKEAAASREKMISDAGSIQYQIPRYVPHIPNLKSNIRYFSWLCLHHYFPVIIGVAGCIFGAIQLA